MTPDQYARKIDKKKQDQTNFKEIHLALLYIFYSHGHSDVS